MDGDRSAFAQPSVEETRDIGSSNVDPALEKIEDGLNNSSKAVIEALNPDGKQELHLDEVLDRMKNVQGRHKSENRDEAPTSTQDKHLEKVIHKLLRAKNGKGLEESDMKKMNERFMSGHLPRLKRGSGYSKSEEDNSGDNLDSISMVFQRKESWLKMGVRHSVTSAQTLLKYAEKSVSKAGRAWMFALLPTGQISTLVSFLLFSYVMKASFLSWFLPLGILVVAICVMLVSSLRLVRGAKRFEEFKAWADFIDAVSSTQQEAIDTDKAEENYLMNHISPYIQFMVATAFCVMAYGTCDRTWVLDAELGILSLVMFGWIVYIYNFYKSMSSIALFMCQISATVFRGFSCGDGKNVFGFLTSLDISFIGVTFNISVPSILRVLLICRMVSLCCTQKHKNDKLGVHLAKVVFPHVVAVAWWDIADMFLCHSSPIGVLRATAEFVALLFAMPVFFAFAAFAIIKYIFTLNIIKLTVTLAMIVVPALYFRIWTNKKKVFGKIGEIFKNKSTRSALIFMSSVFLGYIMLSYRPSGLRVPMSQLSWNDYKSMCLEHDSTSQMNEAHVTAACFEFNGYDITWEGIVEEVSIGKIDNEVVNFLNLLPHSVATWLSCVYGQPYPSIDECAKLNTSMLQKSLCNVSPSVKRSCHVQGYNTYKFQILLSMPVKEKDMAKHISLDVSHDFQDLVFKLKKGSPLRFTGTITKSKSTIETKVLYATTSENGELKIIEKRYRRIENTLGDMLDKALDSLYNFVLYPIVSFTLEEEEL